MASLFISLIVKKYSLKAVKYQIAIQSILIGFVCLLSVLPVAINGTILNLLFFLFWESAYFLQFKIFR